MKTQKNQRGFGLMSVMLALILISTMLIGLTNVIVDKLNKRNASEFRAHIEQVIAQIQQYQYFMVTEKGTIPGSPTTFPSDLNGLMVDFPGQFWPGCSLIDESNGLCKRPDGLPYSNLKLGYGLIFGGAPSLPSVVLTFPLSTSVISVSDRAQWANELQRLPFATVLGNGDITVTIHDPLIMQVYKEFLKRDGSVQLTESWDVANQSILNAKKITVQTQNGRQQQLGTGTVKEYLARHNDKVFKNSWSCPSSLIQTLHVSLNAPMAPNSTTEYIGIAGFKPYAIDNGSYWTLGLVYNAKIKSTGKWQKMNSGFLNVRLNCSLK